MLPLHVQIRGDVVHKLLKESKHADYRCRRRVLRDLELLVVSFGDTLNHGCPMLYGPASC